MIKNTDLLQKVEKTFKQEKFKDLLEVKKNGFNNKNSSDLIDIHWDLVYDSEGGYINSLYTLTPITPGYKVDLVLSLISVKGDLENYISFSGVSLVGECPVKKDSEFNMFDSTRYIARRREVLVVEVLGIVTNCNNEDWDFFSFEKEIRVP